MQKVVPHERQEPTQLEQVLWLHGQYRRSLEPLGVTPLQAGVLLYVRRHTETNMTNIAAALCLRLPTLSEVVKDLVRKRWLTRRRSVEDTRVVHLRLSSRGNALVVKIEQRMRSVETMRTG
ncbi:MAG TPA: MarR family transcriptional regulator [Nitrospiraceae bacterium]|nr:MarR family transcriptional regulator [Nitrospiraceae bacterium]